MELLHEKMFFSATFGFAVYDYIMRLKFRARFWPFIKKRCWQRELQLWLQSGTCLWNVRVHKNVKWTCRLPNKSLSLRRQEHFGLENLEYTRRQEHFGLENLEYTKHLPITYIKIIKWFINQTYIHSLTNEQHLLQQSEECSVLVKLSFKVLHFGRNKNKILPQ